MKRLLEFAKIGRKKGVFIKSGKDDDGKTEWQTRLHKDACVFLNRPGFAAGPGCAFHFYSMRTGEHHSDVKPEVCWQLPLRSIDEEQEDGTIITTMTEFSRDGWGEGGSEFAWWCTDSPDAFVGSEPVYESLGEELKKMMGKKHLRVKKLCGVLMLQTTKLKLKKSTKQDFLT